MNVEADVVSDAKTLKNIQIELKRTNLHAKELRKRKVQIEKKLLQWLQSNNEDAFEIDGVTIETHQKVKRGKKSKDQQLSDAIKVLEMAGVSEASCQNVFDELVQSMKGLEIETSNLKVIEKKKKNKSSE